MKTVFTASLKSICALSATALLFTTGCQNADFGQFCGEINGVPFYQMDANRDKLVTKAEFTPMQTPAASTGASTSTGATASTGTSSGFNVLATGVGCVERHANFEQVDANGDGNVTESEFDNFKNKIVVQ